MKNLIRITSGLILLGAISSIPSNQKAFAEEFVADDEFIQHYSSGDKFNRGNYKFIIEKSKTHVRMREEIGGWSREPITCTTQILKRYKKEFRECYEEIGGTALSGQFQRTPEQMKEYVGDGLKSLKTFKKLKKKGNLYNKYH